MMDNALIALGRVVDDLGDMIEDIVDRSIADYDSVNYSAEEALRDALKVVTKEVKRQTDLRDRAIRKQTTDPTLGELQSVVAQLGVHNVTARLTGKLWHVYADIGRTGSLRSSATTLDKAIQKLMDKAGDPK